VKAQQRRGEDGAHVSHVRAEHRAPDQTVRAGHLAADGVLPEQISLDRGGLAGHQQRAALKAAVAAARLARPARSPV
jgi:hypothetical protein